MFVFALPTVSRSAATCVSGQAESSVELLFGLQGPAEYPAVAHMKCWTSWQQAAGARRAQGMRCSMVQATGEALAAGARRTSSATSWAVSTWMRSTAAPAMAMVGPCCMTP